MAKSDKPASSEPSKMTVMLFQLEDSDEIEDQVPPSPKSKKPSASTPRQPKVLELDLKAGAKPLRQYLE
jgi:hypothetical protein